MKVYLGPYVSWYGPYTIAKFFGRFGLSEPAQEKLGDWIDLVFGSLLNKIYESTDRKVKIRIDDYDLWSMDHTLAQIIHPMLIKFRDSLHSSPATDVADGPTEEHDANITFTHSFERWEYILGEMIFAFGSIVDGEDSFFVDGKFDNASWEAHNKRVENGLRLFGKYFRALWS